MSAFTPQRSIVRLVTLLTVATLAATSCGDGNIRGSFSKSTDGQTYLAIVDDNGGQCGSIKVDGIVWSLPIGKAASISSGVHTIECGGAALSFTVPEGVVFNFDYWGP